MLLMVAVSQRLETGEHTTAGRRICRAGRALRSTFQGYVVAAAVSLGQTFQIVKGLTMRPKYANQSYCTPQNEQQRKIQRQEMRKG